MALSEAALNLALQAIADVAVRCSLHTDDPGSDGSNELDIEGYEREEIQWNTAASAAVIQDGTVVFDLPSGPEITHVGLWSSDGNTWYGSADTADVIFHSAGSLTVQNAQIVGQ